MDHTICPHCDELVKLVDGRVSPHNFPKPTRAVCPGSRRPVAPPAGDRVQVSEGAAAGARRPSPPSRGGREVTATEETNAREFAEARKRAETTTGEAWEWDAAPSGGEFYVDALPHGDDDAAASDPAATVVTEDDARSIVVARTLFPAMLDALEAAERADMTCHCLGSGGTNQHPVRTYECAMHKFRRLASRVRDMLGDDG